MAKLVVLDDDDSLRKAMVLALEREGHEVHDFEDASPALDEVDFDEVDLVVSDLVMPTPGDQFILILHNDDIEVPVIIVSAELNEERVQYLREIGAVRIIEKPFELAELMKVVREVLAMSK